MVADVGFEPTTFRLWAWQATTAPIRDNAFVDFTPWKPTKYGKFSDTTSKRAETVFIT